MTARQFLLLLEHLHVLSHCPIVMEYVRVYREETTFTTPRSLWDAHVTTRETTVTYRVSTSAMVMISLTVA